MRNKGRKRNGGICIPHFHDDPEWEEFRSVTMEYFEYMTQALESGDVWEPVRATKWLQSVVRSSENKYLARQRDMLRTMLATAHRMARRVLIREALHGVNEGLPNDVRDSITLDFDDVETLEDLVAVERHLKEGAHINAGLWRSRAEREQMGLQGAERAAS
jgi:hypothetical protein